MQEHPIPQDITGYRFHIIGSMTLKQFGEILLGVIIGVILFNTNLIAIVKWPLILLSVGMGAAAAFVPIEERPLDHWIITFFKTMYKPTKFYWRRVPKIPEAFTYEPLEANKQDENVLDLTPAKRQRIKEYVGALPKSGTTVQDFTTDELSRMDSILSSFSSVQVNVNAPTQTQPEKTHDKPRMDVRVRKMRKPAVQETIIFEDTSQIVVPHQPATLYEDKKPLTDQLTQKQKTILSTDQVAQQIQIPEEQILKTTSLEEQQEKNESSHLPVSDLSEKAYIQTQKPQGQTTIASQDASYNQDLPFPIKPTEPNKVVGMVLTLSNEILPDAIVEIQTPEGNIARAVKTNALGQFFITTALKPGDYNVVVEKNGYQFQPKHLKIDNTIIPPMEIRSDT